MIQYSRVTKISLAFKNCEINVETKTNVPKKWHQRPLNILLPSKDFKHTECLPSVFSRISGIIM